MVEVNTANRKRGGLSLRQHRKKLLVQISIFLFIGYVLFMMLYQGHFAGRLVFNAKLDPSKSLGLSTKDSEPFKYGGDLSTIDIILNNSYDLVDIYLRGGKTLSSSTYQGVVGEFCKLNWSLQQENPSTVPMFRDLAASKSNCKKADLREVVQRAKELESINESRSIRPTGVVFHQTRCGSTLTANLLASLSPTQTRVYSESPPPLKAFNACSPPSSSSCDSQAHSELIQDVFYMMGRTIKPDIPKQFVFYKIQSIGVHNIHAFTRAMPDIPWVFLYRDSIEVMQSHLSKGQLKRSWKSGQAPVCGRYFANRNQPPFTKMVAQSKGKKATDLTQAEYCASHLAGLALSAVEESKRSHQGRFVNYNSLPDIIWESIVPNHFGLSGLVVSNEEMVKNMKDVALVYSKGRGKKANEEWAEDSSKKQTTAVPEVRDAANTFMGDTFARLEQLSKQSF